MFLSANIKNTNMVIGCIENGTFIPFTEFLTNANLLITHPNLMLTSSEDLDVPFLVESSSAKLPKLFNIFIACMNTEKNGEELKDSFFESLASKLAVLKTDGIGMRAMYEAFKRLNAYCDGNLDVNITVEPSRFENFTRTSSLVNSMNKRVKSKTTIVDNATVFRKEPSDELFIKVPQADALTALGVYENLPNLADVFVPYKGNRKINTMDYKKYLASTGVSIEEVDGTADNINNELYPEEERYFNALCILHKNLLNIEHPGKVEACVEEKVSSVVFKEYITALLLKVLSYHWNQHGYLPISVGVDEEDYDPDSDDDNKASSNESFTGSKLYDKSFTDVLIGEEVVEKIVQNEFAKDCFEPIKLLIQALRFGNKKPSKLKLTGENSFFDLTTFTLSNKSGSFANYVTQKTQSGANYTPLALVEINSRIYDKRFINDNQIMNPLIKLPVGLILVKRFTGTDEIQKVLISFTDLINQLGVDPELTIEGISKDSQGNLVFSPDFSEDLFKLNNNVKLSLNDTLNILRTCSDGSFIAYINNSVRDSFMEFQAFNRVSTLDILNKFLLKDDITGSLTFTAFSLEELKLKSSQYAIPPVQLLEVTIGYSEARLVVGVNDEFMEVQNENPYCTMEDLVKIYKNVMVREDYYGSVFADDIVQQPVQQPVQQEVQQPTQQVTASSVFGGTQTSNTSHPADLAPVNNTPQVDEVAPTPQPSENEFETYLNTEFFDYREFADNEVVPVILPISMVETVNAKFEKLKKDFRVQNLGRYVSKEVEYQIIGYLSVTSDKKYYFLKPEQRGTTAGGNFPFVTFRGNMIALMRIMMDRKKSKVKFLNREVFDYYCNIVEKL